MPIYVYRCDQCQNSMEVLQKVSDAPPAECAHCGAQGQMTKVIAPVGVIFKGTGFHKNDYTATTSKGSASAPKSDSPAGEAKVGADTKGDSAKTESSSAPAESSAKSSDASSGSNSNSSTSSGGGGPVA